METNTGSRCQVPGSPSGIPPGPSTLVAISHKASDDSGASVESVFIAWNETFSTQADVSSSTGSTLRRSDRAVSRAVIEPADAAAIESITIVSSPSAFAATIKAASAPPS